jgi:hypothetical protein
MLHHGAIASATGSAEGEGEGGHFVTVALVVNLDFGFADSERLLLLYAPNCVLVLLG